MCNPNIRATTSDERFAVHNNETVTDTRTGLMWKQCAEGQSGVDCASGSATTHDWGQALEQAAMATHAGYTDWRLPNINELLSVVELKCLDPSINLSVFPNTPSQWFWSSSAYAAHSGSAWAVDFGYGFHGSAYRDDNGAVRLVRGGQ
jgi:hypothetical protein